MQHFVGHCLRVEHLCKVNIIQSKERNYPQCASNEKEYPERRTQIGAPHFQMTCRNGFGQVVAHTITQPNVEKGKPIEHGGNSHPDTVFFLLQIVERHGHNQERSGQAYYFENNRQEYVSPQHY